MKQLVRLSLTAVLLLGLVAVAGVSVSEAGEVERVLVEFRAGRGNAVRRALQGAGGNIHHEFGELNTIAVSLPSNAVEGIAHNPNVVMVEEDAPRYMMGDPTTAPWSIDLVQARDVWDVDRDGSVDEGAPTGAGINVCIIDSGIYQDHEDFDGVTLSGTNVSGTGNWYEDLFGHGTHVAGTIAAALNDVGVVGVTPGAASLHIVKVFGDDGDWAYSSDLIAAADICAANDADIISMSLGGTRGTTKERRAFDGYYSQGILSIAAAGNDGDTAYNYPASYDSVVSVAAIDQATVIADFSQQNDQVELAAPGVAVSSTVPYIATNILTVDGVDYTANHIEYADLGTASGELVDGGLCTTSGSWTDMIVLCERGDNSFLEKVQNVQGGGGAVAVIYNNEGGNFLGTLGEEVDGVIMAISLSQADGQWLVANKPGATGTVFSSLSQPDSGYEAWDGTSMATPHVSAVAALLWSSDPTLTNVEIRNAMVQTALDLGDSGWDVAYGYGLVQAYDAWQYLGGGGSENVPPTASFAYSCTALSCTFDGTGSADSDGSVVSYAWDFGDGSTATGATASHTFAADGSFVVALTVTDDDGASDSDSQTVTVSSGGTGGDTMHVSSIDMWYTQGGRNYYVYTEVTIIDETGASVSGATVSITTNGSTGTGTTGTDGTVTFSVKTKTTGDYTSTVTGVTHATLTYDSPANVETSETLSVP